MSVLLAALATSWLSAIALSLIAVVGLIADRLTVH